jgi:hypothetical protein
MNVLLAEIYCTNFAALIPSIQSNMLFEQAFPDKLFVMHPRIRL